MNICKELLSWYRKNNIVTIDHNEKMLLSSSFDITQDEEDIFDCFVKRVTDIFSVDYKVISENMHEADRMLAILEHEQEEVYDDFIFDARFVEYNTILLSMYRYPLCNKQYTSRKVFFDNNFAMFKTILILN